LKALRWMANHADAGLHALGIEVIIAA